MTVLWASVIYSWDLTLPQGSPLMSTRESIGCGIHSRAYTVRSIVPAIVNLNGSRKVVCIRKEEPRSRGWGVSDKEPR